MLLNKMTTKIAFFTIICLTLNGHAAVGATKRDTAYPVQKAWFDRDYIYVKYKKTINTIRYSLKNIEGEVVEEDTTWYLTRLNRRSIGDSKKVRLVQNKRADAIIYEDSDVSIRKDKLGTFLTGKQLSRVLPECEKSLWASEDVIRQGENLFYCGTMTSTLGKQTWQASDDLIKHIDDAILHLLHEDPLFAHIKRKLVTAFADGKLIVTFGHKLIDSPSIDIVTIDLTAPNAFKKTRIPLPFKNKGYELQNGVTAFSPYNGFVLKESVSNDNNVFFCNQSGCQQIALPSAFSYLLVDDKTRTLYLISQEKMVSPIIDIRVIKY